MGAAVWVGAAWSCGIHNYGGLRSGRAQRLAKACFLCVRTHACNKRHAPITTLTRPFPDPRPRRPWPGYRLRCQSDLLPAGRRTVRLAHGGRGRDGGEVAAGAGCRATSVHQPGCLPCTPLICIPVDTPGCTSGCAWPLRGACARIHVRRLAICPVPGLPYASSDLVCPYTSTCFLPAATHASWPTAHAHARSAAMMHVC